MSRRIDLVWLGAESPPEWTAGEVRSATPSPGGVGAVVHRHAEDSTAAAWLFWDPTLGTPDEALARGLLAGPGDVWHAGLRLGQSGRPGLLDFVHPTWMLLIDPDPDIEASSWRVSLRACLARTEVLQRLGGPRPGFRSLEGAALEMGHRWIRHGALSRHAPDLVTANPGPPWPIPLEDEVRFLRQRVGRRWAAWATLRSWVTGVSSPGAASRAWRASAGETRPAEPKPLRTTLRGRGALPARPAVTVLVPTIDRYPYVRKLLDQLRVQTVPALEILVVDQTPADRRDARLATEFADLPLRVLVRDEPGQCSSRNEGLEAARGDHVLFLDDDVEIGPTLIEDHLRGMGLLGADVSSGVAEEVGAGPPPPAFREIRTSDVFPTNNTLIRSRVLARSGLFDLAYERGQRADGDLGRRVYLSGALMVLNPEVSVLHHRAPRGGLRTHGARVDTYAASRRSLGRRNLPTVSDVYLIKRYGTELQVREALALGALGTFSVRGRALRRLVKVLLGLVRLPDTAWRIRQRAREADRWLEVYPRIPSGERFARGGECAS